jgi:hypothetical protein
MRLSALVVASVVSCCLQSQLGFAQGDEFDGGSTGQTGNPYQRRGYTTPAVPTYDPSVQGTRGYTPFQNNPGNDAADRNQKRNSEIITGRSGQKRGPSTVGRFVKKAVKGAGKYVEMTPMTDTATPGNVHTLRVDKNDPYAGTGGLQGTAGDTNLTGGSRDFSVTDFAHFTTKADGKVHKIVFSYRRYQSIIDGDNKYLRSELFSGRFDIPVSEVNPMSEPFTRMIGTYIRDNAGNAGIRDIAYCNAHAQSFTEVRTRQILLHHTTGIVPGAGPEGFND